MNDRRHNTDDRPNGHTHYRVSWTIDIWADTPISAAHEAQLIQRDPDSVATVFDVVVVDLLDMHVEIDLGAG